jgi:hypothetical protein
MNMQDKEFDDLFRSKLDNFEVEPSAQVWQNIGAELGGRKRKIFPILSIAASVLILLTAGILFIPKRGAVKHNPIDSNSVTVNNVKPAVEKPQKINPLTTPVKKEEQVAAVQIPVKHVTSTHQPKMIAMPVKTKEQEQQVIAKEELVKSERQQILAAVDNKTEQNVKPIELEAAPSAIKKTDHDATISISSQPVLASTPIPAEKTKPVAKKHGIRNFGDLVNLVVAKVDKRKDKLIQFTDSDDDESMISAVHIGAVKIKRDN